MPSTDHRPQTSALIATLKRQLKASGKTYQDIATLLDLSEASIKRLFRDGELSLPRLEKICDAIGLELTELIQSDPKARLEFQAWQRQEDQLAHYFKGQFERVQPQTEPSETARPPIEPIRRVTRWAKWAAAALAKVTSEKSTRAAPCR